MCALVIDSYWGPTKMAIDLLSHLRSILAHPTEQGAINPEASAQLAGSIEEFEKQARSAAAKEPPV